MAAMFLKLFLKGTAVLGSAIAMVFFLPSCKKDTPEPAKTWATPYTLKIPPRFPAPSIPADNPMTVEGVQLGKMLYFDPILSSNGRSCSSCHHPDKSFSLPLFMQSNGDVVSVPPHINLAFNPDYNWAGTESELEKVCMGDFEPHFFNTNKDSLYARLNRHPVYPGLFKTAFGADDINALDYHTLKTKITYSVAQYMRILISAQSKFDLYINHRAVLTTDERIGLGIYMSEKGDCFHCHGYPLLTDNLYHNNGLDSVFVGQNAGRFLITGNKGDMGKFSTPTLRNIEFTAPYMHDGRFATLEQVVEFYNSGVKHSETLDPIMTKPGKERTLNLSAYEKQCLVTFLKTFSDTAFLTP